MNNHKNYNIYNVVAFNVKKYRKQAKLTQEQLALLSGYTPEFIRAIEANNRRKGFSLEFVDIIAKTLKVKTTELVDSTDYEKQM